jgi:hypothetical protein
LLGCLSFDGDLIGYARFLGLVSFGCHLGCLFSHIRDARCYCTSLYSPSDTTRSLSLSLSSEGHSGFDNNTRSLSSEGHLLSLFRSPRQPALFSSTSNAHSDDHALSPQKVSTTPGRPATCATVKGEADVDRGVIQSRRLCVPFPRARCHPPSCHRAWPRRRLRSSSSAALAS